MNRILTVFIIFAGFSQYCFAACVPPCNGKNVCKNGFCLNPNDGHASCTSSSECAVHSTTGDCDTTNTECSCNDPYRWSEYYYDCLLPNSGKWYDDHSETWVVTSLCTNSNQCMDRRSFAGCQNVFFVRFG